MSNFLTTYLKEYPPHEVKPYKEATRPPLEFKDPINESFKKCLVLDKALEEPPLQESDEYREEYVDKNKTKVSQRYFADKPFDKDILQKYLDEHKSSMYQADYGKSIKIDYSEQFRQDKSFGKDDLWTSTYQMSYKDSHKSDRKFERIDIYNPPDNFAKNEDIECLRKTIIPQDTEYQSIIGKLGLFIITEQMHGETRKF